MIQNETENFEAFDLVASALEELELHEASVKAHEAEEGKDSRISASANAEKFAATSEQSALDNARRYLQEALKQTPASSIEGQDIAIKDGESRGDEEYFKAHYLVAITDYFSGQPTVDLFERILNPPQAPDTDAHRAAKKARETADKAFVEEVRYNLGAAYFERKELGEAISQFDSVIKSTEKSDLSLELLARSAKALAHARRWQKDGDQADSNQAWEEIRQVKPQLRKDNIFLFRIGWRNGIILRKRKIDKKTGRSIARIIAEARHELDRKESPTVAGAA
jgi:predicted Zn-dependent protease